MRPHDSDVIVIPVALHTRISILASSDAQLAIVNADARKSRTSKEYSTRPHS